MVSAEEAAGRGAVFPEPKREVLSWAVSWVLSTRFLMEAAPNSHNNPVGEV